jgi:hypothetical protein
MSGLFDEYPKTHHIVFCGLRFDGNGLYGLWRYVQSDKTLGGPLTFANKRKGINDCYVGDVFVATEAAEGQFQRNKERFYRWENEADLREWRLEERAAEAKADADKRIAAEGFGGTTLDEARNLYRKTIGSGRRAALLASLVQHVTG